MVRATPSEVRAPPLRSPMRSLGTGHRVFHFPAFDKCYCLPFFRSAGQSLAETVTLLLPPPLETVSSYRRAPL